MAREVKLTVRVDDSDAKDAEKTLQRLEKSAKDTGSSLSTAFGTFTGNIASTAISLLADKTLEAGDALLDYSARMETASISFGVLLQSGEKAKNLMQDLKKFAADTPFEFPEIAEASKSLLAFGVAQEKIIPTLRSVGDIASGVGVPLTELAEIYGKAKTSGRLFSEDINQLTGRGIPIISEFAKQFGVAESKVKDLVENGKVGFPQLEKAFQDLTKEGGQFSGMMQAQSQTFSGAASTIKDTLTELGATAFEPIFNETRNFAVNFAKNLQSQEAQSKGVAYAFGLSIGESIKKGYTAGFSGVSTKDLFEFGAKIFTKGFGATVTETLAEGLYEGLQKNTNLSIADLRKLEDSIGQVKDKVKEIPSFKYQLSAEDAEKQAKALANVIDDLNDRLTFFGQTSEVAATKQKLINIGIYDFNNANAKTALSVASAIDKLKEAQEATKKYSDGLKSTQEELKQMRDNASLEIRFPENTSLNKFDIFVTKQAGNFRELHAEIEATREALDRAATISDLRRISKINSGEMKRVSNEITNMLNPDTSKLDNVLRQVSDNLGLKGIRLYENSNIDGTDSIFSSQIQSFIKQYKDAEAEMQKLGTNESFAKLASIKDKWKEFMMSFQSDTGLSLLGGDKTQVQEWISIFLKLPDAIQKVSDAARNETFKDIVSGLDDEIQSLNVSLGYSAEISKADAIAKELQKKQYADLTSEMKSTIQQKAEEIDQLKEQQKELEKLKDIFVEVKNVVSDSLYSLFEGDFKGALKSVTDYFKDNFIDNLAEELTTSFLGFNPLKKENEFSKPIVKEQQTTNKILSVIAGKLGVTSPTSTTGTGTIFGGNAGGGIWNFVKDLFGGGRSSSGNPQGYPYAMNATNSSNGNLPLSPNNLMQFLTQQPNLPREVGKSSIWERLLGKGGIFGEKGFGANAGTIGGLATLATLAGGLVGGTAGSFISNIGTGALLGLQFGGPIGAAVGAVGGLIMSIFGGQKQRKADEKARTQALTDAFEALKQFDKLIADVRLNPSSAQSAVSQGESLSAQVMSQYMQTVNALKDKKTRNIAIKDASRVKDLSDQKMAELRRVAEIAQGSADRDKQILPEFATGNYFADFFKPNGMIPGIFDRKDDILAMISRGEMVLNPMQISRVKQVVGFDPFPYADIPNYPSARPQIKKPKFENGAFIGTLPSVSQNAGQNTIVIERLNLQITADVDAEGIFITGIETEGGQRVLVKTVNAKKKSGNIN